MKIIIKLFLIISITIAIVNAAVILNNNNNNNNNHKYRFPTFASEAGFLSVNLTVEEYYCGDCPIRFWTRGYGTSSTPVGIPGPVIRVKAGDTLTIDLYNKLGPNPTGDSQEHNTFRTVNSTNLHTHGLHVTSVGKADNVMVEVTPGSRFTYQYEIHPSHAAGTHWYHAHHHGSTAFQLGGGLVGALIVDDDPATLPPALAAMSELILVVTHFSFYVPFTGLEYVDQEFLAVVHKDNLMFLNGGPQFVEGLTSVMMVNGEYIPTYNIQPGEWVRLRIILAGHNDVVELRIPSCTMQLLARDGIYISTPRTVTQLALIPGGRADIAVQCNSTGIREMISQIDPLNDIFFGDAERYDGVLAIFNVSGSYKSMETVTSLPSLPSYMPNLLSQPLYKERFVLDLQQYGVMLHGDSSTPLPNFEINRDLFLGVEYPVRTQAVGYIDEWQINNLYDFFLGSTIPIPMHPMHVHVNHAQIVSHSLGGGSTYDHIVKAGEYRDTYPIPPNNNLVVRFLPDSYACDAVVHCHIAGHGDMGMMRSVHIVPSWPSWNLPPSTTCVFEYDGKVYNLYPLYLQNDYQITAVNSAIFSHIKINMCARLAVAGTGDGTCHTGAAVCLKFRAPIGSAYYTPGLFLPYYSKIPNGIRVVYPEGYEYSYVTVDLLCDPNVDRGTPVDRGDYYFTWNTKHVC